MWKYGTAWESYPIKPGEVWVHHDSKSYVAQNDIRESVPSFMCDADMVYCDPPWNKGNCNSFITKAGLISYIDSFEYMLDVIVGAIKKINPEVCYVEMGKQNVEALKKKLKKEFEHVSAWQVTYYKKHPCFLLRASIKNKPCPDVDFSGDDESITPNKAIIVESPKVVADPFMGMGLTLLAAHKNSVSFRGAELHPRRLAVALHRAGKKGIVYIPSKVATGE